MRRRNLKVMAGAAAAAVLALTTSACAGSATGGTGGSEAKALTIALIAEPNSLDPLQNFDGLPQMVYQLLAYEPLIEINQAGQLIPGLATKWGYVAGSNNTEFSLTIRQGAEFADGTKVTTQAVANSFNYFAKNATGPTSGNFVGMSATAGAPDTVTIKSKTPNPVLPELLTSNDMAGDVISAAGIAAGNQGRAVATYGAGPFMYEASQSVAGDHYTYVKNPRFFDASNVKLAKVVIKVIANAYSAANALRSGQIDVMQGENQLISSVKSFGGEVVSSNLPFFPWQVLDWQGKATPALKDVRVRQAMNYAIDRPAVTKAVWGQYGSALDQPSIPGYDGYDPSLANAYPYNPQKAKELLAAAGYPHGFSTSALYYPGQPGASEANQAVAAQLANVGIKVMLVAATSPADLQSKISSAQYSILGVDWGAQTQFEQASGMWLAGSPENPFHNRPVAGLQQAFDNYVKAPAGGVGTAAQAVEKVAVDQALTITVALHNNIWFLSPKVKGFTIETAGFPIDPTGWNVG
jgi:peptide/nickel transport system substrate-binding protein